MRFTELRDEQALTAVAELLEPLEEIVSDPAVRGLARGGQVTGLRVGAVILRRHPKAVMRVLGILRGTGEYHCGAVQALHDMTELLADEEITGLFTCARGTRTSPDCACGTDGA